MDCAIGVDLGGTHLRAALVNRQGMILEHRRIRTDAHDGPDAVIERILNLVQAMDDRHPEAMVRGVGIAAPGPLDPQAGVVLTAPNLPGWIDFPLRDRVQQQLDWPVVVGNDADLAAVGIWHFDDGKTMRNLVYVTISTGIGGGIIADGHLLLGKQGLAAEIGHMFLQADSAVQCKGGHFGDWEALASGTALARDAAHAMRAGTPTLLNEITTPDAVTTREIRQAADREDMFACELIEQAGRWCGVAFTNLLHLLSPEAIFIGGGVSNLGEHLLAPAREEIKRRAMAGYRDVPIIPTSLGDNAGLLGAAALVFSEVSAT